MPRATGIWSHGADDTFEHGRDYIDGLSPDPSAVIAGLDPAIHHLEKTVLLLMDARVKPAHDE
ncbi:hypothetical protein KMZ29_21745 [Bradyrhizobium sediminis]|uniref:Uncharacterized protein n=1 Tax=Bradyrhizobium sediminis TaxID=2840469 RepID=A0A975NIU4_9BRAD|nr:hypothetical protein [Bradyrhizobium sediminis]QWG15963.1 hypothetical protein KMZ29_21745 [Bradyrhizobium sediminis]